MSNQAQSVNNLAMDHEQLFDQAVRLAYETFEDTTDAHITGVYAVIVWQAQRGIDPSVTVH